MRIEGIPAAAACHGVAGTRAVEPILAAALRWRPCERPAELTLRAVDQDGDGVPDGLDPDRDNDGIPNVIDPAPRSPTPSFPRLAPPERPPAVRAYAPPPRQPGDYIDLLV